MGVCVVCGTLVDPEPPVSRRDYCQKCKSDLHACRQCYWYDVRVAKQCREPMAEWIADKEKANFCDYFKLNDKTSEVGDDKASSSREALERLFKK